MFVECVKDNIFQNFTTKREERYLSVVSKIILRGKTTETSHKSSICPDIPSEPLALFGFNLRMSETISSLS